jgi:hypothetical protein
MMLSRVTLRKRRNEWGEYVVRAYDRDGRRYPDGDYFTDDWEDAVNTAEAMRKVQSIEAKGADCGNDT